MSSSEPELSFVAFVLSLGHTAAMHFGDIPQPDSDERLPADLVAARQIIDILALLQDKTRGNLSAEERQLLDSLLYELRMRYVEAEGAQGKRIVTP
jgi:hypothetical protein